MDDEITARTTVVEPEGPVRRQMGGLAFVLAWTYSSIDKKNGQLLTAHANDYPPYSYKTKEGYDGLEHTIISAVADNLNFRLGIYLFLFLEFTT